MISLRDPTLRSRPKTRTACARVSSPASRWRRLRGFSQSRLAISSSSTRLRRLRATRASTPLTRSCRGSCRRDIRLGVAAARLFTLSDQPRSTPPPRATRRRRCGPGALLLRLDDPTQRVAGVDEVVRLAEEFPSLGQTVLGHHPQLTAPLHRLVGPDSEDSAIGSGASHHASLRLVMCLRSYALRP